MLLRSTHGQQEALVLKSLSLGQNMAIQDRVLRLAGSISPVVERAGSGGTARADGGEREKHIVVLEPKPGGRGDPDDGLEKSRNPPASISLEDAVEYDLR